MKIIKLLENKRVKLVLVSVLAVLCSGVAIVTATDKEPEEPAAFTAAEKVKTEMRGGEWKEKEPRSQDTESMNENHDAEKSKSTSAKKTSLSANQNVSENSASGNKADHGSPDGSKKTPEAGKTETVKPAHVHDYRREEGTETVTYEVPIIGDKCSSCNEDITGFAEKHIMDTSCRGYVTDIVVGYDTVTEEVPCIYYKCSCGAVKN